MRLALIVIALFVIAAKLSLIATHLGAIARALQ